MLEIFTTTIYNYSLPDSPPIVSLSTPNAPVLVSIISATAVLLRFAASASLSATKDSHSSSVNRCLCLSSSRLCFRLSTRNLGLSRPCHLLSDGASPPVCISFAGWLLRRLLLRASASRHLSSRSCRTHPDNGDCLSRRSNCCQCRCLSCRSHRCRRRCPSCSRRLSWCGCHCHCWCHRPSRHCHCCGRRRPLRRHRRHCCRLSRRRTVAVVVDVIVHRAVDITSLTLSSFTPSQPSSSLSPVAPSLLTSLSSLPVAPSPSSLTTARRLRIGNGKYAIGTRATKPSQ